MASDANAFLATIDATKEVVVQTSYRTVRGGKPRPPAFRMHMTKHTAKSINFWQLLLNKDLIRGGKFLQAIDAGLQGTTIQTVQMYVPHKDDVPAQKIAAIADPEDRANATNEWVNRENIGPPLVADFS